jgi:hypothetical protein
MFFVLAFEPTFSNISHYFNPNMLKSVMNRYIEVLFKLVFPSTMTLDSSSLKHERVQFDSHEQVAHVLQVINTINSEVDFTEWVPISLIDYSHSLLRAL